MRVRRLVTGSLGAGLLLAILAWPVFAAASLTVMPAVGAPGQLLTASGTHDFGVQQITLQWDGFDLSERGSSDVSGNFSIQFAIPSGANPGGHQLRVCIRGDCTFAPPFTVAVIAGTPPPNPTPASSVSTPPITPAPSGPGASTTPSSPPSVSAAPADSPVASAGATPSDGVSAAPDASPTGGLAVPSIAPTSVPSEPKPAGTIKVQFPWDRIAIAAVFGLGVLLIFLAAVNEKWLKGSGGMFFGKGTYPTDSTGEDAPMKTPKLYEAAAKGTHAPKTPKLYEAAAKGTHAPPGDEPTAPSVSEIIITKMVDGGDPAIPSDASSDSNAEPDPDASKDVKLKGKNIGEN